MPLFSSFEQSSRDESPIFSMDDFEGDVSLLLVYWEKREFLTS